LGVDLVSVDSAPGPPRRHLFLGALSSPGGTPWHSGPPIPAAKPAALTNTRAYRSASVRGVLSAVTRSAFRA
jgi:hypothetical protein